MVSVWFRVLLLPWLLPMAVLMWLLHLLPLLVFGQVDVAGRVSPFVWMFRVRQGSWYSRMMAGWVGFSGPMYILLNSAQRPSRTLATIRHEIRHCDQWFILGPLFLVVYGLLYPFYGYRKHPLEIDARRAE